MGSDKRLDKEFYTRPVSMNMVEENGKIWMALLNTNGICEVDRAAQQGRICGIFEEEPLNRKYLYGCVEKVGKYLFFAPLLAEKIAVFDLEHKKIFYISLKEMDGTYKENTREPKFWNVFRHQSSVYLLGYSYPAIVKIDITSMEVTYIVNSLKKVREISKYGNASVYFGDGQVLYNHKVLLPLVCINGVLELDLKTLSTKLIKVNVSMEGIGGIASLDGEKVWISGRGDGADRVACWERTSGIVREFSVPNISGNMPDPFFAPVCTEKKIFLLPISAPYIYTMDIPECSIKECSIHDIPEAAEELLWKDGRTIAVKLQDGILRYLTCADLKWHELEIDTGSTMSYFVHWKEEKEEEKRYFRAVYSDLKAKKVLLSEKKMPLKYLLSSLTQEDVEDKWGSGAGLMVGRKIYEKLC